jgi:hypothetical protein
VSLGVESPGDDVETMEEVEVARRGSTAVKVAGESVDATGGAILEPREMSEGDLVGMVRVLMEDERPEGGLGRAEEEEEEGELIRAALTGFKRCSRFKGGLDLADMGGL